MNDHNHHASIVCSSEGNQKFDNSDYLSNLVPERERRDTMESQASSTDYNFDNGDNMAHLPYSLDSGTLEDFENDYTWDVVGEIRSLPAPLQRSTTFERVLSDAIIHRVPVDELKVILEAGSKVLKCDARKPNPLHYTVWQNYPEATELVLQSGYDVNTLDDFGFSALHLAARHGYTNIVSLLLINGACLNYNNYDESDRFPVEAKDEPLRIAIKYDHTEVVKLLLEHGANPNARYFFGCEINLTSSLNFDILSLLISFGANVNEQDRNGLTPLMKASRMKQGLESILLLISNGADVNMRADFRRDRRTALHYAVLSGSIEIVTVLIENGALINFGADYDYPTPLYLSVRRGDIIMINLLLDYGAYIDSSTSIVGSVLHMACSEKTKNRIEVMELLLRRGADPNIVVMGLDGSPMLPPLGEYLVSSEDHSYDVINLFLKYGAVVIMSSSHSSPLSLLNCVSYLRQKPSLLEELLEGAQQFEVDIIRHTKLLSSLERKLLVEIGKSPLPLKHQTRICLRNKNSFARPEDVLRLEVPSLISRYLLYEIS